MDDEPGLHDIDRRVRAALAPDETAIHRVLARALQGSGVRTPVTRARGVARVTALVCAAVLVAATVWRWRQGSAPEAPPPPAFTITGSGSVVVVDSPDGRRWVVGSAPARRTGGNYVIVLR
jgi:hypothetical protein